MVTPVILRSSRSSESSSGSSKRRRPAKKRFRIVGSRDEIAPYRLRQRFYQRDNQLATQARDLPFKPGFLYLVEQRQRNMHRYAIGIGARFKLIAKTQFKIALMPEIRVVQFTDLLRPSLISMLFSKLSKSGVSRLACFHHLSKWRAEMTSWLMRWS